MKTSITTDVGFFRSLFAPVYAMGKLFVAAEKAANVLDMYASQLEMQTEITMLPVLQTLNDERARLFPSTETTTTAETKTK